LKYTESIDDCVGKMCTGSCDATAVPDTDIEDIVIDEAFARSKGCAMPELVNLLDDPDVLQHLKASSASVFKIMVLL